MSRGEAARLSAAFADANKQRVTAEVGSSLTPWCAFCRHLPVITRRVVLHDLCSLSFRSVATRVTTRQPKSRNYSVPLLMCVVQLLRRCESRAYKPPFEQLQERQTREAEEAQADVSLISTMLDKARAQASELCSDKEESERRCEALETVRR